MLKPIQTEIRTAVVDGVLCRVLTTAGGAMAEPIVKVQKRMSKINAKRPVWVSVREFDKFLRAQILEAVEGKEPDVILPGHG